MSDATIPVLAAIKSALDSETPSITVYGDVPDEGSRSWPYVTLGELTAVDDGTKSETGQSFTLQVNVWSRYGGWREAYAVRAQIYDALHEQSLSVAGFTHVQTRFEFADAFPDEDGRTRRALARYRVDVHA